MENYNNLGIDKKMALYCKGKRITDYIYDSCDSMRNRTVMKKGNVLDVFDNVTGEKMFSVKDVDTFNMNDDTVIFSKGKYYGAYSYDGTLILEREYLKIDKIHGYFVVTDSEGNTGVYKWKDNKLTEIIEPMSCLEIRIHEQGIMVYKNIDGNKVKGYYTLEGRQIVPIIYTNMNFNSDGIYVTDVNDKTGFYSYSGKELIPAEYDGITSLNNSFIVYKKIKNRRRFGLWIKSGKQILKPIYDSYITKSPYVIFSSGDLSAVYDLVNGKRILPLRFRSINVYYNVIYASEDLRTFSLYSGKTGKQLLENKFKDVKMFDKYVLKVTEGTKNYYYLTRHNVLIDATIWEVKYSEVYQEVLIKEKNSKKDGVLFTEWIKYQN